MSYLDVFKKLNDHEISYVVPRKYETLPQSTVNLHDDVDIIIEKEAFESAVNICSQVNFSENGFGTRYSMIEKGISNPKRVLKLVISDPRTLVSQFVEGKNPTNPRHRNVKLYRGEQMLDLRNNLAYKSPMNRQRIPVRPEVTTGMIKRRKKYNEIYVPTPSDELAHIIPHCLFDKQGTFSDYYKQRCSQLTDEILTNPNQLKLLNDLLSGIFFSADELILTKIKNGEYNSMYHDLKKFSEY